MTNVNEINQLPDNSTIKVIQKALPRGGVPEICKRTGLSRSTVSKIIYGVYTNSMATKSRVLVIKTAIDIIEEFKQMKETISAKMPEL